MKHTIWRGRGGEQCRHSDSRRVDDAGAASILEVAFAAFLLLVIITATAFLLLGQETASVSFRAAVHAQSLATAEVDNLQAEAAAVGTTGTFPPSDATTTNPSWTNDGSSLTELSSPVYDSGLRFDTYVVGGWCALSSTADSVGSFQASDWAIYPSTSPPVTTYSMSDPPIYWVGVVVTWVKANIGSSGTASVSSGWRVNLESQGSLSSNRLVMTAALTTPSGTTPPSSSTSCPAELS